VLAANDIMAVSPLGDAADDLFYACSGVGLNALTELRAYLHKIHGFVQGSAYCMFDLKTNPTRPMC